MSWVSSVWWGGGQAPVGVAVKPPAALVDRAVVGPADQGQVVQVGGAAMEPMSEMVGFAPGRGPLAAGEGAAAVADDQGGALGGGDDPAGPADLQRLGRGTPKGRGEPARRRPQPGRQAPIAAVVAGRVVVAGVEVWWLVGWRVTSTRVTAPSQASRRHASGSSGPAPPASPPRPPGRSSRLSRSTVTVSWGRTPPVWGSWPASRLRRANSARASARRWSPVRSSSASAGRAKRFQGGQQGLAGLGLQQPVDGDHALKGGGQPQPPPLVAPLGLGVGALGVGDQPQMGDDPAQPGRVQPPGRLHQDRFGLGGEVVGQVVGAVGQHLGVGG